MAHPAETAAPVRAAAGERLRRFAAVQAGRHPRAAMAVAGAVARLTPPLSGKAALEALGDALPGLSPAERRRIRRAAWANSLKSRTLDAALGVPGAEWPYPPVLAAPDPAALRPPMVLATAHIGPIHALGVLMERLHGPSLVLESDHVAAERLRIVAPAGLTTLHLNAHEWQRAAAFQRGVKTLRAGGFVLLAVDGRGTRPLAMPLFGREVWVARGAFALSRLTGAPILPVIPRWRGPCVEIMSGEPIQPGDERAMAAAFLRWLESYVRESPAEVGPSFLAWLQHIDR
jgi:hypothetical protein